jgi:hypothetical protein
LETLATDKPETEIGKQECHDISPA